MADTEKDKNGVDDKIALMWQKKIFLLVIVIWGGLVAGAMKLSQQYIPDSYPHNDFYIYWVGAKLFWQGQNPYGITPEFKQLKNDYQLGFHWATGYSYPPFLAIVFYPLTLLPPKMAAWIFFGINVWLYGMFVYRVIKKARQPKLTLLYLLTFVPALGSLMAGQINFIWLWLVIFFIEWRGWSPVFSGIMAMIKVYPAAIGLYDIVWFPSKKKIGVTIITLVTMVIILINSPYLKQYFTEVLPKLQGDTDTYVTQQSINAVIYRFFPGNKMLVNVSVVGIILMTLAAMYRQKRMVQIMIMVLGTTLIAGRTTFWNFLPTILGQLYLFEKSKQKRWLIVSVFCSNVGWWLGTVSPYLANFGFIYGIIQLGLFLDLPKSEGDRIGLWSKLKMTSKSLLKITLKD